MDLVQRNLQEVIHGPVLEEILSQGKHPRIYWGTAPTGKPHCGYLVPMTKIADFLHAGCHVIILLADLHAFLDSLTVTEEVLYHRVKYYEKTVKALLRSINVPIERLEFVQGSTFQKTPEYTMDLLRLFNKVSQNDARRAGAEVVKQHDNPPISGLVYPLMQALDEEYLKCDAQFGGVDQRKIFVLAEEQLPTIGYKKRVHLMNPLIPGLTQSGKMSASDPNSKIDFMEDEQAVKKKISKAFAAPGVVEGNGLIALVEFVFLPISDIKTGNQSFVVNREEKWGGPVTYTSIEQLKNDYAEEQLSPADLKLGVADALNAILKPIRETLSADPEFAETEKHAYPPPVEKEKKVKKKKDKGSRYPGGKPQAEGTTEGTDQ